MTLEAWVKPQAGSGRRTILAKLGGRSFSYAVHSATPRGGAGGEARIGRGTSRVGASDDLPLGRWTHVGVTYDGSTLRLYQNATEVSASEVRGRHPAVARAAAHRRQDPRRGLVQGNPR